MSDYGDDRYGMMRIHIASRRADLACARFSRDALRHWAKGHGSPTAVRLKHDLAWYMAQHGLIDAEGNLRDGFPS
jgi:hypothetical protein